MYSRIVLVLLFGVSCAGLTSLGFWQLQRAEVKRDRHAAFLSAHHQPALSFGTLVEAVGNEWRKTTAEGHYGGQHILLDNRIRNGRPGYEVLTPFRTDGGRTILVDRGWVALLGAREVIPDVNVSTSHATVSGYLGPPPVVGLTFDESTVTTEALSASVWRLQRIQFETVSALIDTPVWPAVVYLDADREGALSPQWKLPGDGSDRHTAYAVQWFAMAVVLAMIGLYNLRRSSGQHD